MVRAIEGDRLMVRQTLNAGPYEFESHSLSLAAIAQLVSATDCRSVGWGFESPWLRHL